MPLHPTKTAEIKQTDNTEYQQDGEEQELSYTVDGNTEGSKPVYITIWQFATHILEVLAQEN